MGWEQGRPWDSPQVGPTEQEQLMGSWGSWLGCVTTQNFNEECFQSSMQATLNSIGSPVFLYALIPSTKGSYNTTRPSSHHIFLGYFHILFIVQLQLHTLKKIPHLIPL